MRWVELVLERPFVRACVVPIQSMPLDCTLADQLNSSDQSAHLHSKTLPFTALYAAPHVSMALLYSSELVTVIAFYLSHQRLPILEQVKEH